jgi:hypothetical protein
VVTHLKVREPDREFFCAIRSRIIRRVTTLPLSSRPGRTRISYLSRFMSRDPVTESGRKSGHRGADREYSLRIGRRNYTQHAAVVQLPPLIPWEPICKAPSSVLPVIPSVCYSTVSLGRERRSNANQFHDRGHLCVGSDRKVTDARWTSHLIAPCVPFKRRERRDVHHRRHSGRSRPRHLDVRRPRNSRPGTLLEVVNRPPFFQSGDRPQFSQADVSP